MLLNIVKCYVCWCLIKKICNDHFLINTARGEYFYNTHRFLQHIYVFTGWLTEV